MPEAAPLMAPIADDITLPSPDIAVLPIFISVLGKFCIEVLIPLSTLFPHSVTNPTMDLIPFPRNWTMFFPRLSH